MTITGKWNKNKALYSRLSVSALENKEKTACGPFFGKAFSESEMNLAAWFPLVTEDSSCDAPRHVGPAWSIIIPNHIL